MARKQQMKTGELAEQARHAGVADADQMNRRQLMDAMQTPPGRQRAAQKSRSGGGQHAPAPKGSQPQDWKNIPGNQS